MSEFVPGLHQSHDWHQFDSSERPESRFCHRCEVCTCHSPVASREPCDFAFYPAGDNQTGEPE